MKNQFENLTIQYIQLEEKAKIAEVEVQFIKDKVLIETILMLGLTDLNKLLAQLNRKGISLSLSEDFDSYSTEEGNLYTLDFSKKGWNEIEIENFIPQKQYKERRA